MKNNVLIRDILVIFCLIFLPVHTYPGQIFSEIIYTAPLNPEGQSGTNDSDSREPVRKPQEEVKAGLIKNFPGYCTWPFEEKTVPDNSPFIVGAFEKNDVMAFFSKRLPEIKIKGREVKVLYISDYKDIQKCHLLYISKKNQNELDEILKKVDGLPILTVSDTEGYEEKGIIINIVIDTTMEKQKPRFIINRTLALKCNLKLSSRMLQSALKIL